MSLQNYHHHSSGTFKMTNPQGSTVPLSEVKPDYSQVNVMAATKKRVLPLMSREGDRSQSFSSVEEFHSRSSETKRKSLFDGIKFPIRKRKRESRGEEVKTCENFSQESLDSFLLMYDCKFCQSKFSKLGEFRTHVESAHSGKDKVVKNDDHIPPPEVRQHIQDCALCGVFRLDPLFKFPFGPKFQARLLTDSKIDISIFPGFCAVDKKTPAVKPRSVIKVEGEEFLVNELKGKGGFAKVYSATWRTGPGQAREAVMKVQKPCNDWEWYVLNSLHQRLDQLDHPLLGHGSKWHQSFMSSPRCFNFQDGSIIISKYLRLGTVLDFVNLTANGEKSFVEPMAIIVVTEILAIIELLHSMNFIHGDLKPDNLMLTQIPSGEISAIQLIDFGKVIDLSLMPEDVFFNEQVTTSGLKTVEMREKRPYR